MQAQMEFAAQDVQKLDFNESMLHFKTMFPFMEEEVMLYDI